MSVFVVTIDGPAGAGKSTVAKALACRLGVAFLDTGAMYRALTFKALCFGINLEDAAALEALARGTDIDVMDGRGKALCVFLDGKDVSQAIRTAEVTNNTFYIARVPGVRRVLVEWQRRMGEKISLVGDGRDLGTVVFPDARYKFFLDADFNIRCRRRIEEIRARGVLVDEASLERDIFERDQRDRDRQEGPLKQAEDAVYVDSTEMSVGQVVEFMVKCMER